MHIKVKQFIGVDNIQHLVNDFLEEEGVYKYEVVGFQTIPNSVNGVMFTSILIKYDERDARNYLDEEERRKYDFPF